MKKFALLLLVAGAWSAAISARAGIIAGPITNPANGHDYYLLTPNTWTASEAEAESLGGTLAIVKSAELQRWVFATFSSFGGTNRNLWIGLYRREPHRSLGWVLGGKLEYANWTGGQPDDAGGVEGVVFMASPSRPWGFLPGGWADTADYASAGDPLCGVAEVPGKSNEEALTEKEKALIGTWYESGNAEQNAWITGTQDKLFLVTHDRHAARLTFTPEGYLYNTDRLFGEVVNDKILWSNGTWWSQRAMKYDQPASAKGEASETH
jgi:hypothetical protein